MAKPLRIATRGSELALAQARLAGAALKVPYELVIVETSGDKDLSSALGQIGGQGIFVKEVQIAVLQDRADIAVHSAKDLPSDTPTELKLVATLAREDPRDALVGSTLVDLAEGATVATSSQRRAAQLLSLRPDVKIAPIRGNIATRLARSQDYDAVFVAVAALLRLGLIPTCYEVLDPNLICPQVGQGTIALECRIDNEPVRTLCEAESDVATLIALRAERAFLAQFGTGCTLPIGALAKVLDSSTLSIAGIAASPSGTTLIKASATGSDPLEIGSRLAHSLIGRGALSLLGETA